MTAARFLTTAVTLSCASFLALVGLVAMQEGYGLAGFIVLMTGLTWFGIAMTD